MSANNVITTNVDIASSPISLKSVYIGSYNLQEQGAANSFIGFCVDPFQWASSSYKPYEQSDLDATDFSNNGATRFANAQKLFDNAYSQLAGDSNKTAGFHLALWEIFHDDLNVTTGDIKGISTSDINMLNYASGFLDNLPTWQLKNDYKITFYNSETYQNFIGVSQVPVPAALPLFASGLAGLGFMRRKMI